MEVRAAGYGRRAVFDFISWIVFGLFVGIVARLIVPGRQRIGVLWTLGLGIAGSVIGGVIAERVLDIGDDDALDFGSFIAAVIVATFLVAIAAQIIERGDRRAEKREKS